MRNSIDMFDQIEKNKRNSVLLIMLFLVLAGFVGYVIGFAIDDFISVYFLISIIVLIKTLVFFIGGSNAIMRMNGARKLEPNDSNYIYNLVETVSISAGMSSPPEIYIIETDMLNAFATGRSPKKSAIGLTRGIINKLNREELEGVIAHEISHIINRDTLVSMIAIILSMSLVLLSRIFLRSSSRRSDSRNNKGSGAVALIALVLYILMPIVTKLLQFGISRQREYLADANGAVLTRNPKALASALRKISGNSYIDTDSVSESMYIESPLKKVKTKNLFSTHPPIDERISRLENM